MSSLGALRGRHVIQVLAPAGHMGLDVSLDVVDGDDRPRLETLASTLGVAQHVTFHGRVDDSALRASTRPVTCLPYPLATRGIVYLEAMAFARPVVAADSVGSFVVRPGEGGWLVPYGEPAPLAACFDGVLKTA